MICSYSDHCYVILTFKNLSGLEKMGRGRPRISNEILDRDDLIFDLKACFSREFISRSDVYSMNWWLECKADSLLFVRQR